MIEVVWQYDRATPQKPAPATASQAEQALVNGNRAAADLLRRADDGATAVREVVQLAAPKLGLTTAAGKCPAQTPFAAVLGCADARVPVELIWWQEANDLFVVRVAGNAPGSHSMGSLDCAVYHLPTVYLLVVLTPASYIGSTADMPLRSIIDSIMTAVCAAADALRRAHGDVVRARPGYREALVELTVILNAALTAVAVRGTFRKHLGPGLGVAFGVYNLANHLVGLPDDARAMSEWHSGLHEPPRAATDFSEFALRMAGSSEIGQRLLP